VFLDYWGTKSSEGIQAELDSFDPDSDPLDNTDFILAQVAAGAGQDEERTHQASHIVVCRLLNSDITVKLSKASEINSLLLGYALTVHKSQGSEWRKVFLLFHHTQAAMTSRELLYTAVTRAREELYVICEPNTFEKGIQSQRIVGNTLAEKAEAFKGKLRADESYEDLLF
jgi:hypothetical protein